MVRATDGYAGRLKEALAEGPRPMSVRRLADKLQRHQKYKRLRGVSYSGVRQYAEEKIRVPRAELLRAMADILGVRAEWLAYGEGPLTEAEEPVWTLENTKALEALERFLTEDYLAALQLDFGERADRLVWGGRRVDLTRAWRRLSPSRRDVDLGRAMAHILRTPLEALGIRLGSVPDDVLDDYVAMMCGAVMRLSEVPAGQEASDA